MICIIAKEMILLVFMSVDYLQQGTCTFGTGIGVLCVVPATVETVIVETVAGTTIFAETKLVKTDAEGTENEGARIPYWSPLYTRN
jgi:hypothetical protein